MILIYNMLCAIKFFHSANLMHRDIKPSNLMVDENCSVVLCDFGLARTIENKPGGKKRVISNQESHKSLLSGQSSVLTCSSTP